MDKNKNENIIDEMLDTTVEATSVDEAVEDIKRSVEPLEKLLAKKEEDAKKKFVDEDKDVTDKESIEETTPAKEDGIEEPTQTEEDTVSRETATTDDEKESETEIEDKPKLDPVVEPDLNISETVDDVDEEPKEEDLVRKDKRSKKTIIKIIITIIIILLLLMSCGHILKKRGNDNGGSEPTPGLTIDKNQGDFKAEEEAGLYVRQVTLPGWGAFNIPANELTISQGFEFHNPAKNAWYEDTAFIGEKELETFIVGENEIEIDHLLRLAGIKNTVKSVVSYNEKYFDVYENSDNKMVLMGVAGFEGEQEIVVETANGDTVTITFKSAYNLYYMTFGLYLGDPTDDVEDELLYQSNLVEPGKYIQRMELTKALRSGEYDAYVICQPYKADASTPTNNGIVKLVLRVG